MRGTVWEVIIEEDDGAGDWTHSRYADKETANEAARKLRGESCARGREVSVAEAPIFESFEEAERHRIAENVKRWAQLGLKYEP